VFPAPDGWKLFTCGKLQAARIEKHFGFVPTWISKGVYAFYAKERT
jgi:hypothetical protein